MPGKGCTLQKHVSTKTSNIFVLNCEVDVHISLRFWKRRVNSALMILHTIDALQLAQLLIYKPRSWEPSENAAPLQSEALVSPGASGWEGKASPFSRQIMPLQGAGGGYKISPSELMPSPSSLRCLCGVKMPHWWCGMRAT